MTTNRLLFATSNLGKQREIERILKGLKGWELRFLDSFGKMIEPPEETAKDFKGNAAFKSGYYRRFFKGYFVASEDSGLSVAALGGAPGVYSARYKNLRDDEDKVAALLEAMKDIAEGRRSAWFEAVISLSLPDGKNFFFSGKVEGTIAREARGRDGFGYDPVFIPEGFDRTFAEMTADEKDRLSHRRKALEKLKEFLVEAAR